MKVYIVVEEDRGCGQTICGVYLSQEAAEKDYGDVLGGNYWLEEHEVHEHEQV